MIATLGSRVGTTSDLFIKTWPDVWKTVAEVRLDSPITLSEAGARGLLTEAIRRARSRGVLRIPSDLSATSGFRKRLRERFASWTRDELSTDTDELPVADALAEEWSVYLEYRDLLNRSGSVDREGLAVWASKTFESGIGPFPTSLRAPRFVNLLDYDLGGKSLATQRALAFLEEAADIVRVSIAYDPDPGLAGLFAPNAVLRHELIEHGYEEWPIVDEPWRPTTLQAIEESLFQDEPTARPRFEEVDGLKILGGPKGEGEALLTAREIKRLIEKELVGPEEILVVTRQWNDQADTLTRVLKSWGLPVAPLRGGKPLASEPAVSALLLASEIPRPDGWEASRIVQLLRHGMVRPTTPSAFSADRLARAASAVRETLVFQGRDFLRGALDRAINNQIGDPRRTRLASEAREVVAWLIARLEVWSQPRTFLGQGQALATFAAALGLGSIEPLEDALNDQASALEDAGEGKRLWTFSEFADELKSVAHDLKTAEIEPPPESITITTLDRAAGARAAFVFLVNLSEGSFPTREAVESTEGSKSISSAYAREMSRFLRVFGAADEGVYLSRPTRDEKGQEILSAGFLDDVRRLFDPTIVETLDEVHDRFDPALRDQPDLAIAPSDARVLAVARAAIEHQPGDLSRLAADPLHQASLRGTSIALDLAHRRRYSRVFDVFDGRLQSPKAAASLAKRFAPDVTFSASQLESYLHCRFQFFMNYVLGLKPVNDDDELIENVLKRGTDLHRFLEELEQRNLTDSRDRLELVDIVIANEMRVDLISQSDADSGLQAIEIARTRRQLQTYARQAVDYERKAPSTPRRFEVQFGQKNGESPPLELGEGDDLVKLQGKIDRIDWVETESGPGFRVIDYKSGRSPSIKDVKSFVKLQLPLYALAVERLGLAGGAEHLIDLAYWELREKGYKPVKIDDWPAYREQLVPVVIDAVRSLRAGGFEVNSTDKNCTQYCDFSSACRIKQVRDAGKRLEETPS